MGVDEHRSRGGNLRARCAIITVSDSRTLETDKSGQWIVDRLGEAEHLVVERTVVPDEAERLRNVLGHWLEQDVDAVLLNGGTGIAARDGTVEVVREFLDRELPGFGELFRFLSYEQIGAAAMLSRALGGIARGKLLFALPGSSGAVRLAMEKLIVPELKHLLFELQKDG
jgi:molybdenum cofactor biosynthesis protein B